MDKNGTLKKAVTGLLLCLLMLCVMESGFNSLWHRVTSRPNSSVAQIKHPSPRRTIDPGTGVRIVCDIEKGMFPDDWVDPDSTTSATPPKPDLIAASVKAIERELKKYPKGFVRANLKGVYVVNSLVVDSVPTGGMNCPEAKRIYIDLDDVESEDVDEWVSETLHHEMSHLLVDNHPDKFSEEKWTRLNNKDFHYGNGGTEAIKEGLDSDDITDIYLKQGFIEQYGESDAYEDFATICERLFVGDQKVSRAIDRYPVLHRKAEAVKAFYRSLNPAFNDSYFENLRKHPVTPE